MLSSINVLAIQRGLQIVAITVVALMSLTLLGVSIAAAAGLMPWLTLPVQFGDTTVQNAGMVAQIGLTSLLLLLLLYLPSNFRVLALETSHRNFQVRMEDVANAYWAAHRADRTGLFKMQSEFDAVKERILWLRDHPDLHSLEPDVMELSAQMSQQSAELARTYSDENVVRAREFLEQRLQETKRLEDQIECALVATREVKQIAEGVELEESILQSRIETLRSELQDVMHKVGLDVVDRSKSDATDKKVILLPPAIDKTPKIPSQNGSASIAAE